MTDQKLLQEAIDVVTKFTGNDPCRINAFLGALNLAGYDVASLTPVPDQARAEALELVDTLTRNISPVVVDTLPPFETVNGFSDTDIRAKIKTIRQCLQAPPVTADAGVSKALVVREVLNSCGILDEIINDRLLSNQIVEALAATPSEVEKMQVLVVPYTAEQVEAAYDEMNEKLVPEQDGYTFKSVSLDTQTIVESVMHTTFMALRSAAECWKKKTSVCVES